VALTNALHGALGTWTRHVDAFIALSPFARDVFVRGGIPAHKLHIKGNFLADDPGPGAHDSDAFLFVGRLSDEKGVRVLLDGWAQLPAAPRLRMAGDGPLRALVEQLATRNPAITYLGALPRERVLAEMQQARALIVPSLAQENSPLALLEAFATATPVLASDLQNLRALTDEGKAGWLFRAGDGAALADAVMQADADVDARRARGAAGRQLYQQHYTAAVNYQQLMHVYEARAKREALLAV
jgi:glycosyltransferase involved in cell wall biosynthesis